jgi:hypothetical protein
VAVVSSDSFPNNSRRERERKRETERVEQKSYLEREKKETGRMKKQREMRFTRESTAIFQLFSSKDETLLVGRDSFLVLDLGLHILNSV